MSSRTRACLLSLTIIAVLIFSAIGPTIVYADDGTTSDTTTADTSGGESGSDEEATDTGTGEGESDTSEPAVEEIDETGSDGEATDATGEGDPAAETAEPEPAEPVSDSPGLLSEVPENTTVTVLDAAGDPQPLATQEAAEAIASTTDPIWCPDGQPPIPGANGCTPSFTSFDDLLTFLSANASFQGAGTIYVQQGAYNTSETSVDFNAYNLSNINNSNLTVQGGWNTATNTVDPASTSNFTIPIIIGSSANPWGGSLTIFNIVINDPDKTGLILYSQNDINLLNVEVHNSATGDGAVLNAGGDVTVINSKFLRNTAGARITAGGNVAIASSEFSNPYNQRRQVTGLEITSNGSVSLFEVLAIGNRRRGVDIDAGGRVTIGSSVFSETNGLNGGVFYGFGLRVVTPDAIDLANVTANNNFLWGADLNAGGDVAITDSIFNANSTESPTFIDDTGLLVTSGGNVALNNVEANGNRLIGTVIDAVGIVSINNSTFSNNRGVTVDAGGTSTIHGLGLQVTSLNSIFLNGVTASGNSLFGAHLESGGEVAIANSTFSNNDTGSAADPSGRGLEVISTGNVSLANVILNNNQTFGGALRTGGDAFLDMVTATNNGLDGLQVEASCTHLIGGTYTGNGQYGLNLIDSALNLVNPPTFGGNGAGDIFPENPDTCTLVFSSGSAATSTSNAGSSSAGSSSLVQAVSFNSGAQRGGSASLFFGASLNSLMYGITREAISGGTVTSIFVGNYVYVYTVYDDDASSSIDGLEIIVLNSEPQTQVAMVGP